MANHPCPYPDSVLEVFQDIVDAELNHEAIVLDNMAGIGRIHELSGCQTVGIEIEPEWASQHSRNICGDATALPFASSTIDAVFVSCSYGNRLADQYLPPDHDTSSRLSYAISLGRKLSEGSGAKLAWGPKYQALHASAWAEAGRVLKRPGLFVLNVKDYFIRGERQQVCVWHQKTLESLDFHLAHVIELPEQLGWRNSPTRLRDHEKVFVFRINDRE